eukprot:scaffold3535_cov278-Skeletonema_marinoi.AAC.2
MMRQRRQSANNVETDGQEAAGEDMLMNFQLSASFLEVYGEDIHDLMDDDRKCLPIREDSNGKVIVKGLQETPVTSDAEAMIRPTNTSDVIKMLLYYHGQLLWVTRSSSLPYSQREI